MDKRAIGVYLCSGCSIGESVNLAALANVAEKECKAALCLAHPRLCSDEARGQIRADITSRGLNAVVVAACSPRVMEERFAFEPPVVVERVNLREQVVWSHTPNDEDTQMLAADNLRMGMARAARIECPTSAIEAVSRSVLVVGGGITGLKASLHAARAGMDVVLVEKQPELGGAARFAVGPEAIGAVPIQETVAQVLSNQHIRALCSTAVERIEGQPGMFDVTLRNGSVSQHRVGAIVMATGWKPYDATKLGKLGYGSPDVMTNVEFDSMAASGPITCKSTGREPDSVLFVQCAGSRSAEHLPYCSAGCCMSTLRQVSYLREKNSVAKVFVIYRDMMTPGPYEHTYRAVQDNPLNFFLKGEVDEVVRDQAGKLHVRVLRSPLAEEVHIPADIVVLATGMVPNSADNDAIRTLRDARRTIERNESETQRVEAEKTAAELAKHEGTEILNLAYRQGPDLPVRRYGFPESHYICFPYETQRTGIYAAGAVRAPMDAAAAEQDAAGAVMKAVQCIAMAARGQAVHPRAGDVSVPEFSLQRCTQCKRCTVECPFGTLDEDEKGTPKFNAYRCRRCGICMGACPERIVAFKNYSVDSVAAMVKAIEVPDEFSEKPRVLVFACENDAYPALDLAGIRRAAYDPNARVIPLRCLGSLNIVWIADALSRGFDGILLLGCKFGDDYQCHFIRGSELANRRLENVKDTLQKLQLEPERVQLVQLAIDDYSRVPEIVNGFVEKVRALGPNPYKGF